MRGLGKARGLGGEEGKEEEEEEEEEVTCSSLRPGDCRGEEDWRELPPLEPEAWGGVVTIFILHRIYRDQIIA